MDNPTSVLQTILAKNYVSPNYSIALPFETNFKNEASRQWMEHHWHYSVYFSVAYVILIFAIQALMEHRRPFDLRRALAVWSGALATFSIIGASRTLPEFFHVLQNHGFHATVCNPSYLIGVPGLWTWFFVLSKVPELGDTLFIVLRKQKLIFLHWYHHITVLIFTWDAYVQNPGVARYYVNMNYTVHAVMYSYYTIRALGYRLPKPLAMLITIMQIMQMFVGFWVTYYAYSVRSTYIACPVSNRTVILGLSMYASYFVLFAHFFINSYFGGKSGGKPVTKLENNNNANHDRKLDKYE